MSSTSLEMNKAPSDMCAGAKNLENTVKNAVQNTVSEALPKVEEGFAIKKAVRFESIGFLVIFFGFFVAMAMVMGGTNMINSLIATAFDLLINTAFYVLAVAVLAGAIAEMLNEFGIISAANKFLSPIVKRVYGMPGACVVGMLTTYFSDNPAIITFAENHQIRRLFKKYQLPALTNLGTCFGMGMVVSAVVIGIKSPIGESFAAPVLLGNVAAIIGGIVSTRIMLIFTAKKYGKEAMVELDGDFEDDGIDMDKYQKTRDGSVASRVMSAAMDGGASGVKIGMQTVPGILIFTTIVIMLTRGAGADGAYTGAAYQGVAFLPTVLSKIDFILKPLFGFSSVDALSVPLTAIGSGGASISLIPSLVDAGLANAHDIAVFTAMCMCWSGYLSTHVAMMDCLKERDLTGKAILAHTIGGICAGVAANLLFTALIH